jgi:hypothetical protein
LLEKITNGNVINWFNVLPGSEICNEDISEEYTHWIPVDHPDKWGK